MGLVTRLTRATFDFIKGGGKTTITVNYWGILFFIATVIISTYLIIRYRILTMYSYPPDDDLKEIDDSTSYIFEPCLMFKGDEEKEREDMDVNEAIMAAMNILGHVEKPIFNRLCLQTEVLELQPGQKIPDCFMEDNILVVITGRLMASLEPLVVVSPQTLRAPALEEFHQHTDNNNYNKGGYFLCYIDPGQFSESVTWISKLLVNDVELPPMEDCHCRRYYQLEKCGCYNPEQKFAKDSGISGPGKITCSPYGNFMQWGVSGVSYMGARVSLMAVSKARVGLIKTQEFNVISSMHPYSTLRFIQSVIGRLRRLIHPVIYKYLGFCGELFEIDRIVTRSLGYLFLNKGIIEAQEMTKLQLLLGNRSFIVQKHSDTKGNSHLCDTSVMPESRSTPMVGIARTMNEHNGIKQPLLKYSDKSNHINSTISNHVNNVNTHKRQEEPHQTSDNVLLNLIKKRVYKKLSEYLGVTSGINDRASNGHSRNRLNLDHNYSSLELLRFSIGEVIVNQDEKDVGLYLIIDGIVEATFNPDKATSTQNQRITTKLNDMEDVKEDLSDSSGSIHASDSNTEEDSPVVYRITGETLENTSLHRNSYSSHKKLSSYIVCAGGILCYLSAITGIPSPSTYTAKSQVIVAKLSKSYISYMIDKYPKVLLYFAKRFAPLSTTFMHHVDVSVKWEHVPMGHAIWKEGDELHGIYIVMYGRLRSITENKSCKDLGGKYSVVSEYGQGASVGESEIINNIGTCPFTLYAVRDSEVAFIPREFLDSIIVENSNVMTKIALIAMTQKRNEKIEEFTPEATSFNLYGSSTNPIRGSTDYKTFALIPLDTTVPINYFATELRNSLINIGATVSLINQESFLKSLGVYSFRKYRFHKYSSYFESQEESNRVTLYVADSGVKSFWATQCIKRADIIFLVANINGDPVISEYERLLMNMKVAARKELVFIHSDRNCSPGSINRWLQKRGWIQGHHYVHMNSTVVRDFKGLDYSDGLYPKKNIDYHSVFRRHSKGEHIITTYSGVRSDFSRLARRITSSSVGFILSGGGARGIAHVGILKAFEERGIPIDMIGGCSIGAFVGALYACENNIYRVYSRTKMFSARMSTFWRKAMDITYPYLSLFTGHEFNRGIWKCFKNMLVEECWLPYFCVTSNLTNNKLQVHQSGYLWKYVRASMTIVGYLPPICDEGNMLVDGGYINNVPCDIMRFLGVKTIIAIDVSPPVHVGSVNYGDSVSGWWLLLVRIFPFIYRKVVEKYGYLPSLGDVQTKLSFASNVRHVENIKKSGLYTVISLPVQKYEILEFDKFNELYHLGYEYGKQVLKDWEENSMLEKLFGIKQSDCTKKNRIIKSRRASI